MSVPTPTSKPRATLEDIQKVVEPYLPKLKETDKVILVGIRAYYRDTMGATGKNDYGQYDDALFWLAPQHLDEVGLDEDHRREVIAGVQLELRLIAAREAVVTAVGAAAIRVQRPLHERHALAAIECGAAADFLVSRGVTAALRIR